MTSDSSGLTLPQAAFRCLLVPRSSPDPGHTHRNVAAHANRLRSPSSGSPDLARAASVAAGETYRSTCMTHDFRTDQPLWHGCGEAFNQTYTEARNLPLGRGHVHGAIHVARRRRLDGLRDGRSGGDGVLRLLVSRVQLGQLAGVCAAEKQGVDGVECSGSWGVQLVCGRLPAARLRAGR